MRFLQSLLVCALLLCLPYAVAQTTRQDVGTKLLIPSSARTESFTTFLAVLNLDTQPNNVVIRARRTNGSVIGQLSTTIPVGGRFRSTDVLGMLGAAIGEFGPLTVESTNGMVLSAVSEVSSAQGPGGFFPGVNFDTAWREGYLSEVIDTGDPGTPQTFRTNIGLNTVGPSEANVTITFYSSGGTQMGSLVTTVPGNGMTQLSSVARLLLNSGGAVTGRNGYLRISSNQPIIAWASKVENGTGDPSFQLGIAAVSVSGSAISVLAIADIALAGQPDGRQLPSGGDSSPLNSPVLWPFSVSGGQTLHMSATGLVGPFGGSPQTTPDGHSSRTTFTAQAFGISAINGPFGALIGVFLGPDTPNENATPPNVDFTGAARELVTLNPLLQQPFYIGRGRTANGTVKSFVVPTGATRLFLGVLDRGGDNSENTGSFSVTISFSPSLIM
jgi:hypothetical protein